MVGLPNFRSHSKSTRPLCDHSKSKLCPISDPQGIIKILFWHSGFGNMEQPNYVWVWVLKRERPKYRNESAKIFAEGPKNRSAENTLVPKDYALLISLVGKKLCSLSISLMVPKRPH